MDAKELRLRGAVRAASRRYYKAQSSGDKQKISDAGDKLAKASARLAAYRARRRAQGSR